MTLPLIISTIFTLHFPFVIANDAAEIIDVSGGYTNVLGLAKYNCRLP